MSLISYGLRIAMPAAAITFAFTMLAGTVLAQEMVWTERVVSPSPAARSTSAMAFDRARSRVVLFGGHDGVSAPGGELDETWEWDGSNWIQRFPLTSPPARRELVPRPRVNLTTYHGVFAPAASYRARVVPEPPEEETGCPGIEQCAAGGSGSEEAGDAERPSAKRRRFSWAELMKRVHRVDVLICESCGGRRKVLAYLTDGKVITKILTHLGLPAEPPVVAPARAPPVTMLPFG